VPRKKIASKGLIIKAPRYAPMVPMREKFTLPSQSSFPNTLKSILLKIAIIL
jgi:hypothetical protein